MDLAIKLIVLLPLLAAAIAGLFCRVIGDRPAQIVTCAALLIAAALSIFVFVKIGFGPENAKLVVVKLFTWIDSATLDIVWSLRVDTLTAVMLIVVTGVLVDGPCLFDRLHGGGSRHSRASCPTSACSPSSC